MTDEEDRDDQSTHKLVLPPGVYKPREDSHLVLRSLTLKNVKEAVDVGSGSGLITLKLAESTRRVLAIDINPVAAACTLANAGLSGLDDKIDVVCGDLLTAVRQGRVFDVIVFNPPYLPHEEELPTKPEDVAWDGGPQGLETALRLVAQSKAHLAREGELWILLSSLSSIGDVAYEMRRLGFEPFVEAEERGFFEVLVLVRAKASRSNAIGRS